MFNYGVPVTGSNFYDRSVIKEEVNALIVNHSDFMIKSPRRYGKTSLISNALRTTPHIYLDLRRVPRMSLLADSIIDQAYSMLGIKGFMAKIRDNAFSFIKELRLSGSVHVGIVEIGAEIAIDMKQDNDACEHIIKALEIVEHVGESLGKKVTIVFDEFQDIKRIDCGDGDILEILRGHLQHLNHVHSIFLGSSESLMTDIFENRKSPFFNYCRKIKLEPFDFDEVAVDITKAFKKKQIVFENDSMLISLLERLSGHPANTMLTMQILYFIVLKKGSVLIKRTDINKAFDVAYREQLDLVEQYISEIRTFKNYHDVLYRMANKEKQVLNPQALYQVRRGLVDKGILVAKERDQYVIADNFLEEYLKKGV